MKSYWRIIGLTRNYLGHIILNLLFNILNVLFSVVSIAMLIPFLRLLFNKDVDQNTDLPPYPKFQTGIDFFVDLFNYHFLKVIKDEGKIEALIWVCMLVIIVFFLKNVFRYVAVYFMGPIRMGVVRDLRRSLYDKIVSLPIGFYSEEKKGDIIARLTTDVQEIEYGIMSMLEITIREPLIILAFLGFMIYVSPSLTIFVFVMLLLTGLVVGRVGKTLKRVSKKGQVKMGHLISMIDETLMGLRVVKAFNGEMFQIRRFGQENDLHYNLVLKRYRRRELSSPLTEFLAICIVALVLWFGGKMVILGQDTLQPELFITFMVVFSQMIQPVKGFSGAFFNIQKGLASSERVHELLDARNSIKDVANPVIFTNFNQEIEFRDVSFAYADVDVLKHIDLRIEKGKTVAIVGQSGAGKSTLADMVPRFYDPQSGHILIDGIDIREVKITDLRKQLGVVTQESILFNDSVFNNIAFGIENVTPQKVEIAAKVANAHEFIMNLENGYDSSIGDRGNKLSGGEKQRITIARALLKNPPILILDEATSSLDTESEKLVQDAIYKLMQHRTCIVIAHRLSTIKYADQIIVMQEGEIIERGDHSGLSSKNGAYKKLLDLQAF